MKKLLVTLMLILSFGISTSAFAATSDPTKSVLPPTAVGTYSDFGQVVRLDINPNGTNASQFKVYWKRSNTTDKYQSFYADATPNIEIGYVWYKRTGFTVPSLGWYDLMVVSVRSDGNTSKPWIGSIDILR